MTINQAERFRDRWVVIDQHTHTGTWTYVDPQGVPQTITSTSGLAATIFEDKSTHEQVLAIRGTNDVNDVVTDLVDIALLGTPERQAQFQELRAQVAHWLASGELKPGFAVAGHSLGGFLAGALLAEYPALVEHAYLYNAPGTLGVAAGLRLMMGLQSPPKVDFARISNLRADAGSSYIAGLGIAWGPPIHVAIEDQNAPDVTNPPAARNHSQQVLTDALAVYDLYGKVDPTLAAESMRWILHASSPQTSGMLESAVQAMGKVFGFPTAIPLAQRESLHAGLQAIGDHVEARRASGAQFTVTPIGLDATRDAQRARTDPAVRFALAELSPFAVIGADYGQHATRIALHDPATGAGEITEPWLLDRAEMLRWWVRHALADGAPTAQAKLLATGWRFEDLGSGRAFGVPRPLALATRNMIFGAAGGDVLTGGAFGDRLYGMEGNDTIVALAGSDTVDAGSGDDTVDGGTGRDEIRGGTGTDVVRGGDDADRLFGGHGTDTLDGDGGEDTLDGGPGADVLRGGSGSDTYIVRKEPGVDTIVDFDGKGSIVFEDAGGRRQVVAGVALVDPSAANTWRIAGPAGTQFTVTRNSPVTITAADGAQVVLPEFASGSLRLTLATAIANEATTATIVGDTRTDKRDTLAGTAASELIQPGVDSDTVMAGAGADRVQAGSGRDVVYGQDGNDVIEGQADADVLHGDAGDDRIFADAATSTDPLTAVAQALADGQAAGNATQGDWLAGGAGNDILVGGTSGDGYSGGGGSDVLVGGGGSDSLLGDAEFAPAGLVWSTADQVQGGLWTRTFTGMNAGASESAAAGNDSLYGGGGNDFALGGGGDDAIHGDAGDDFLEGDGGNDVLLGGEGIDQLVGDGNATTAPEANGADWLEGGAGNDVMKGGGAADTLLGGDGDDSIYGDDLVTALATTWHGNDRIDGGAGNDAISADGGDDEVVGGTGTDTLSGGDGADVLAGGDDADYVDGGSGDDNLAGDAGDDQLLGGDGDDAADGGSGADRLWGGPGADLLGGGIGQDYLDGGAGADALSGGDDGDALYGFGDDDGLDGGAGNDVLYGGLGADHAEGGEGDDQAWGEDGDDDLAGGSGGDFLDGGAGNDSLAGEAGDDVLWGGEGSDRLAGGEGNDRLFGGGGDDTYVIDGEAGTQIIVDPSGQNTLALSGRFAADFLALRQGRDGAGNDRYLVLEAATGGQRVVIAGGLDGAIANFRFADGQVFTLAGLQARAPLTGQVLQIDLQAGGVHGGTAGDDAIAASPGGERVLGNAGNDSLVGSAADDVLDAGEGNDRLDGGAGSDTLIGGRGGDTYVFGRDRGRDFITEELISQTGGVETDTVELAAGVMPADVTLHRDGADLVLAIGQTQAQLRVQGHFRPTANVLNPATGRYEDWPADRRIEQIRFADGTLWDAASLAARTQAGVGSAMAGTTGNDIFTVDSDEDAVTEAANGGDDTIRASVSYALRPNVERLVLTGFTDLAAWSTPGNPASHLTGNAGNNAFNGPGTYVDASGQKVSTASGAMMGYATMTGGAGDDTYHLRDATGGLVVEAAGEGTDTVVLWGPDWLSYPLPANVENLKSEEGGASYAAQTRYRTGNALANTIEGFRLVWGGTGPSIHNVIDGGAGADTLIGFGGNDVYIVDDSRDRVVDRGVYADGAESSKADEVRATVSYVLPDHVEQLVLTGVAATDGWGNRLDNGLDGAQNAAANRLAGGLGDDFYRAGANDTIVEQFAEGIDTVEWNGTGTRTYTAADLPAHVEGIAFGADLGASGFAGDARADRVTGNASANRLEGGGGDDRILGGDGNDTLVGGTGSDFLQGDGGMDVYAFSRGFGDDVVNDTVYELSFDASVRPDEVYFERGALRVAGTADRIRLQAGGQIRFADGTFWYASDVGARLAASHSTQPSEGADTLTGSAGADTLDALGGDDYVNGLGGADTLAGGSGNDQLAGHDGDDAVRGDAGADRLLGGAGNDRLDGGEGTDTLQGDEGADRLEGGSGDDALVGNAGDDIAIGGDGWDWIHGGDGNDVLRGDAESGVGAFDGVDSLSGEAGDDTLAGGGGADSLQGGAGTDTYLLEAGGGIDNVVDELLAGERTIVRVDAGLGPDDVTLAREVDENWMTWLRIRTGDGQDGLDLLDYGDGAHPLEIRFADGTSWQPDTVLERLYRRDGTAGDDLLSGTDWDDRLYGLDGSDVLAGLGGNDRLDGGSGNDTMDGGDGDDVYVVDAAGDVVVELAGAGTDAVESTVSHVLAANVERLVLAGIAATNGTGNAANNAITGNSGNNVLDGKAGADVLAGGAGNDTYVVDNAGDTVAELAGEGIDAVQSAVTHTLAANVEQLTLTGTSAISGTGNALANTLRGNAAANTLSGLDGNDTLDGGAGADSLKGGAGDDSYVVDNTADTITELAGGGIDRVTATASHTLAAEVEHLTLSGTAAINGTGNALANQITGNAAANVLDGKAGADTLTGGAGNDTYVVDQAGDVLIEGAGGGTDTVQSAIAWTLGAHLENLTLTGTAAVNGTGNALANTLTGNAAANVLDGGAGADTLRGGGGNDVLIVDNAADVVVENATEGEDTVKAYVGWTLAANVEHLTLVGTAASSGTGNALDNWLQGNAAANALAGGDGQDLLWGDLGDDTLAGGNGRDLLQGGDGADAIGDTVGNNLLHGGAGNDALTGGAGSELFAGGAGNDTLTLGAGYDVVAFNRGDGQDVVTASTGTDNTLALGGGIRFADIALRRSSNDLVVEVGAAEQVTLRDWYLSATNKHVVTLQMVVDASADWSAGSADALRNRRVARFDFAGLVGRFDAARAANPALASWSVAAALAEVNLGGSDTAALGGDLGYQFGHAGAFSGIAATAADGVLAAPSFGSALQAFQPAATLFAGSRGLR